MNKLLSLLLTFTLLLILQPADAQTGKKQKAKKPATAVTKPAQSVRGAATAEELGNLVFEALKSNDATALDGFFPAQTDLESMSKSKDEDVGLVMEETNPDQVRTAFVEDFQTLVKSAMTNNVSFAELALSEVQPPKAPSASRLLPIKLMLSSAEASSPVIIVFEAMKINGRYFLFQNIGLADS